MSEEQGFILKPETYNQKEWYELFMNLSKEYRKKCNIINELEKWLEDNLGNCRTNQNYTSNQIYNLKEDTYYRCLDKLKELKESNKDV